MPSDTQWHNDILHNWYICAGASQQTDGLDWWKRSESFVMIKERYYYFSYVHSYSDKCFVFFFFFFSVETWRNAAGGQCLQMHRLYQRVLQRQIEGCHLIGSARRHAEFTINVKTNQGEKH